MTRPVAFTDANVLYAAAARDLLIELAVAKAITLRWTEAIHDEWTAALARTRPDLDPQRIQRTREPLLHSLPGALVADYEPIIPTLRLPDANDRHVLAAAIKGGCQLILTFNVADFLPSALAPHNLAAVHPDAVPFDTLHNRSRPHRRRSCAHPRPSRQPAPVASRLPLEPRPA
jgi:hypothetical protein